MAIIPSYGAPRTRITIALAIIAAFMLLVMITTQSFGYDDQPTILATLLPFDDQPMVILTTALVILAQLLALPYLLGMYISRLMRAFGAFSGCTVALFWLLTAMTNSHAPNSGMFSSIIELPGGLLAAVWSLVLFGCIVAVIFADSKFQHDTTS